MTANVSSQHRFTRGAFLTAIAFSPLVVAACSPTLSSPSKTAAAGIGTWTLIKHDGVLLLQLRIPITGGARIGNQFPVTSSQLGLSETANLRRSVHFSIVRDAGTFDCTGTASAESGYGAVLAFRSNQMFAAQEESRFPHLTQADMLKLALFDVDTKFIANAVKTNRHVTVAQIVEQKLTQRFAADQL